MNEQQKVQRYEPSGPGFGGIRQADDGDFVLYCDYDQLRQRVAESKTEAEDRFEQYVADLIEKNPSIRKLGERLGIILDAEDFNSIEPALTGLAQQFAAAEAKLALAEQDARRYRWLRSHHVSTPLGKLEWWLPRERSGFKGLDEAIDAAIAGSQGESLHPHKYGE